MQHNASHLSPVNHLPTTLQPPANHLPTTSQPTTQDLVAAGAAADEGDAAGEGDGGAGPADGGRAAKRKRLFEEHRSAAEVAAGVREGRLHQVGWVGAARGWAYVSSAFPPHIQTRRHDPVALLLSYHPYPSRPALAPAAPHAQPVLPARRPAAAAADMLTRTLRPAPPRPPRPRAPRLRACCA